ncbi:MAG: hypothetical protein R3A78_14035 [Polyangiales bacterium]|nr:hypothetical protein [Myxococcales bacterium]
MSKLTEERRIRRSDDRFVALRYQLEHTRGQAGIEALVLADDTGLVVASSGDAAVCAELGAVAPLISRSFMGVPMPPLLRSADVAVRRVEVLGQELFLACTGGGVARDAHLRSSLNGVTRILAAN